MPACVNTKAGPLLKSCTWAVEISQIVTVMLVIVLVVLLHCCNSTAIDLGVEFPYSGIGSVNPHGFGVFAVESAGALGEIRSVCNLGDINGDGLDDAFIGYQEYMDDAGIAAIVYGTEDDLESFVFDTMAPSVGFYITFNDSVTAQFGFSCSSGGDYNDDGISDFLIGSPGYDDDTGAAILIWGTGKDNWSTINALTMNSSVGILITGPVAEESDFGRSVEHIGDFNGDGVDDFMVSAHQEYVGGDSSGAGGAIYIFFGKSDWDHLTASTVTAFKLIYTDTRGRIGTGMNMAGDFNNDSFADIIFNSPSKQSPTNPKTNQGALWVYLGSDTFVYDLGDSMETVDLHGSSFEVSNTTGLRVFGATLGEGIGGDLGGKVCDFNADGYDDVMYGSETSDPDGQAYILFGKDRVYEDIEMEDWDGGVEGIAFSGSGSYKRLGDVMGCAGDINGDGYPDLYINSRVALDAGGNSENMLIIFGQETFVNSTIEELGENGYEYEEYDDINDVINLGNFGGLGTQTMVFTDDSYFPPGVGGGILGAVFFYTTYGLTDSPTESPTVSPSTFPSMTPTMSPTLSPTVSPTATPTVSPTSTPSDSPTISPSGNPSVSPTVSPSATPTVSPTYTPTTTPTVSPTIYPSVSPTVSPTAYPSDSPTVSPSTSPSTSPTTSPSIMEDGLDVAVGTVESNTTGVVAGVVVGAIALAGGLVYLISKRRSTKQSVVPTNTMFQTDEVRDHIQACKEV